MLHCPLALRVNPSSAQAQGPSRGDRHEPSGLSQLFHRCQRAVQALPGRARRTCSEQEERLLRNVVASLAQVLQELSSGFRHAQAGYLRREFGLRVRPEELGLSPAHVAARSVLGVGMGSC